MGFPVLECWYFDSTQHSNLCWPVSDEKSTTSVSSSPPNVQICLKTRPNIMLAQGPGWVWLDLDLSFTICREEGWKSRYHNVYFSEYYELNDVIRHRL